MAGRRRGAQRVVSGVLSGLLSRVSARRAAPDPFRVLALQVRLSRLAREIGRLRRDERQFAKAHHLRAASAAYDHALDEACQLAGIPVDREGPPAVRRVLAEAALRDRGWTW